MTDKSSNEAGDTIASLRAQVAAMQAQIAAMQAHEDMHHAAWQRVTAALLAAGVDTTGRAVWDCIADLASERHQRGWDECMSTWADHMKRMNDALSKPLPNGYANHAHHMARNVREALQLAPAQPASE